MGKPKKRLTISIEERVLRVVVQCAAEESRSVSNWINLVLKKQILQQKEEQEQSISPLNPL